MNYSNFSLAKLQSLINLTESRLSRARPGSTEATEAQEHLDTLWAAAMVRGRQVVAAMNG